MGFKIDSKGTVEDVMGEKTVPVTGGCLCGAVRYESTEEPISVAHCHCRMCQQAYGHVSGLFVAFEVGALRFTKGEPKYFKSSAPVERGFCTDCGSPLGMRYGSRPATNVLAGTLDHPEEWPPNEAHYGIESHIPWNVIHDDLGQGPTDPDFAATLAREWLEQRGE